VCIGQLPDLIKGERRADQVIGDARQDDLPEYLVSAFKVRRHEGDRRTEFRLGPEVDGHLSDDTSSALPAQEEPDRLRERGDSLPGPAGGA
jgi:hypothetical protein